MLSPKLICVVGARPNFIKIAPIMAALTKADDKIQLVLVHTGQHYDKNLADNFFQDLSIKAPDYQLRVGSGTQAWQTAQTMLRFEKVLEVEKPSAVLVVGDINATLACSLVCAKLDVPIIHVEAGLRSFDKAMPEEINRLLTDQLSTMLFTTEMSAKVNLLQEGISANKIHFVGNVMIDTLLRFKDKAKSSQETLQKLIKYAPVQYGVLTLHRPSNVDNKACLLEIINTVQTLSEQIPFVFPCHPRTYRQLQNLGIDLSSSLSFHICEPLDYLTMLSLVKGAKCVLTDSGGLQEETTALNVPCLTLRYNTERPVTITHGTNQIVGAQAKAIKQKFAAILINEDKTEPRTVPLWDGHASERIAQIIVPWLYQIAHQVKLEVLEEAI